MKKRFEIYLYILILYIGVFYYVGRITRNMEKFCFVYELPFRGSTIGRTFYKPLFLAGKWLKMSSIKGENVKTFWGETLNKERDLNLFDDEVWEICHKDDKKSQPEIKK